MPDFAWDPIVALGATRDLDVEVLVPLPAAALARPRAWIRRLRGDTPWPEDLEARLLALDPRPTIIRYVPVLGRSIESATVAVAAHLIQRRRAARPRVLQGSFLDEGGFAAAMAARAIGCASIAVAHGTDVRFARGEIQRPAGRRRRALATLRDATQLLAVSSHLAQALALLGKPAQIVRFTTFAARFPEAPAALAARPPEVLFVGRIGRAKGVDLLLDAFAQLRDRAATLRLVGPCAGDLDPARRAAELGIGGRVTVEPEVRQADLPSFYARASAVVLPSRSEGFGNVLVEAMLTGRPVIGSDLGGIRDIITSDRVGRLAPPEDAPGLAAAIDDVLARWSRGAFIPGALRAAATTMTWESQGPRLADVARRLILDDAERPVER